MTDLDLLIAAVEAGEEPSPFDASKGLGGSATARQCHDVTLACRGSFDAAWRLHKALLPKWGWALQDDAANVIFRGAKVERVWDIPVFSAQCVDAPARAWALATLKGYRAEMAALASPGEVG